ncbi:MAG: hypothetical protein HN704_14420 [Bacteroidetes bacterium]|jgi:hypothetical protein|nr:hypothetical protein [Bacteroidota bacterium]MBT6684885.1 hypothetical protein [Bacteroidota bacterium]MBT7141689.1 hypothetical protein [Bacteroidota bacterium]MBT7492791.1 hypothetical protein [Bacteroidota bacterium]
MFKFFEPINIKNTSLAFKSHKVNIYFDLCENDSHLNMPECFEIAIRATAWSGGTDKRKKDFQL